MLQFSTYYIILHIVENKFSNSMTSFRSDRILKQVTGATIWNQRRSRSNSNEGVLIRISELEAHHSISYDNNHYTKYFLFQHTYACTTPYPIGAVSLGFATDETVSII